MLKFLKVKLKIKFLYHLLIKKKINNIFLFKLDENKESNLFNLVFLPRLIKKILKKSRGYVFIRGCIR